MRTETLRPAGKAFVEDGMPLHAAALAFFSLLTAAPLFAAVALGARLLTGSDDAAQASLADGARALFGDSRGDAVVALIEGTSSVGGGAWAFLVVLAMFLFAASRLFAALSASMNRIFGVRCDSGRDLEGVARKRAKAFSILVGLAFLLLVSLVLSSLAASLAGSLPLLRAPVLVEVTRLVVVGGVIVLALAPLYRHVPDAHVRWGDVWRGSAAVGVLLAIGERLMGLGLAQGPATEVYGPFAPIIFALLWAYYTALVVLLGGEYVNARAHARGDPPAPEGHARRQEKPSES
ncbi:MAG TPA: YihY/virulence factor BrkB family protein [Candidatus Thermoplasmatota archaeon]|nr:YihY/virulence factor BrkB family protein [Candidatus Thermoplasmatota archaeon]